MTWITENTKEIDQTSLLLAQEHQAILTKPAGSLGRLETIATQFSGWQSTPHPKLDDITIAIFAADHGICQQQVSAFPQEVTMQMIINFLEGGAAISVLSEQLEAKFAVYNVGIANELPNAYLSHPQLNHFPINSGTADFSQSPAMTKEQCDQALSIGQSAVTASSSLFIGGEMGIGNTTCASAIYAALLDLPVAEVVGPGTGIDENGLSRKQAVIETALSLHQEHLDKPYEVLRCLGGFEIAALVGSYVACAQKGVPALVDGFICTAAALLAIRMNPSVKQWLLFSHCSAEPAHKLALQELSVEPLLDLGLRLGEGSGAAVAVPILQSALNLHNNMATFAQAGVSDSE